MILQLFPFSWRIRGTEVSQVASPRVARVLHLVSEFARPNKRVNRTILRSRIVRQEVRGMNTKLTLRLDDRLIDQGEALLGPIGQVRLQDRRGLLLPDRDG